MTVFVENQTNKWYFNTFKTKEQKLYLIYIGLIEGLKCSSIKKQNGQRQKDNRSNYHFLSRFRLYHPFFLSQICFAEERKHDSGMLADSGLLPLLERHGHSPSGQPMCVYALKKYLR